MRATLRIAILFLGFSNLAQAALFHRCWVTMALFLRPTTIAIPYQDLSYKAIRIHSTCHQELKLGRIVGTGFNSYVYDLPESEGILSPAWKEIPVVVKVPHIARVRGPFWKTSRAKESRMKEEVKVYGELSALLQGLPVIPIAASFETDLGTVLVKPKFNKMKADLSQVPKALVEEKVRDLYRYAKNVFLLSGNVLDLRPDNLTWVPEEVVLPGYRIPAPVVILDESGLLPENNHLLPNYLRHMTEDEYVKFALPWISED